MGSVSRSNIFAESVESFVHLFFIFVIQTINLRHGPPMFCDKTVSDLERLGIESLYQKDMKDIWQVDLHIFLRPRPFLTS
jgi:hypothetical protein